MGESKRRFVGAILVAALMVALLTACGGGASKSDKSSGLTGSAAPNSSLAQQSTSSDGQSLAVATSASASSGGAAATTTSSWDRKIIRNADLTLQVNDVESFLSSVRSMVDGVGGIVFASSTSYSGDIQTATMTLDVPSDQFDLVVSNLRSQAGVKKVVTESISSQDVTDDYVDLQSQLTNLKATEARLMVLMDKATDLQDILTVQDELSKVEGQIEQTTGRINYLDKKTSFSRITLTLSPVGVAVETKTTGGLRSRQSGSRCLESVAGLHRRHTDRSGQGGRLPMVVLAAGGHRRRGGDSPSPTSSDGDINDRDRRIIDGIGRRSIRDRRPCSSN